jgi:hypothetical protein
MTEEIVFEEKQPANEVMSREELEAALGSPTLRKACLKSGDPELHLKYLNTMIHWYSLEQEHNTRKEIGEIAIAIRGIQ